MADAEVLTLEIATPAGLALATECESVAAPSVEGEFGVFPGHLPLLGALRTGVVKYRSGGQDLMAAVGPGFVEAGAAKVLLLTDSFARPEDVDRAKVQAELAAAEERLDALETIHAGHEYEEIARSIAWAHARLAIIAD